MHKNKILIFVMLWIGFILIFISFKGIYLGWNNESTDFNNYYLSSKLLLDNEPIHQFYDNDWFNQKAYDYGIENGAKFAPFTPSTPLLYLPISFWSGLTAKRVWLGINVILLVVLPFRLKRNFNTSLVKSILICSLFFVPISSNLNFGQAYLLLSFLLIESIGLVIHHQKIKMATFIIAFSTLIKYVPILYLVYFIRDRFKPVVIFFSLSIIGFVILVYIIDPLAYHTYFNVLFSHLQGDLSGQGKFAIGFQSIDALLNNLFVFDMIENPDPAISLPILKPILKWTLFAIVGGSCFYLFRADKYQFTNSSASIFMIGAYILFPASASYHFLFLILPVLFIIKWLSTLNSKKIMIGFIGILLLVFIVQQHHIPTLIDWPTLNLIIHFPRLWHLMLLFVYLLFIKLRVDLKVTTLT